ncbi:YggS family pyridoxal phosphate-dependent enzyme [Asaia astilbis]|uniref:YggS family pyridoxal phosphate-dependent enzyme n=1 Tax=Asaia astilbis TaxID=610244 RepID=UPI000472ED47|nr:YggS family pyridoxal phosphate-dependent enzyme [Asaia astilbis]
MSNDTLSSRLDGIRTRIARASEAAHRPQGDVRLVAVSKFHPASAIEQALKAGQRLFGENRVQEAKDKFPALREQWPDLRLHIIGSLQTNKAAEACRLADVIESVDRPALVDALSRAADRAGRLPDLFVQVNTGDEPQKSGIPRQEADAFIASCKARFGGSLKGVMCIPPEGEDPSSHFAFLAQLAHGHELTECSMGMSADFETAIGQGATLVRVGTAIFGSRPTA